MNKEIKEILGYIDQFVYVNQSYNDIKLSKIDSKLILDYITNLQNLCNKYEEEHNNEFQCWKRDRKELLDKIGRINKAIEYIELGLANEEEAEELLDILKGKE